MIAVLALQRGIAAVRPTRAQLGGAALVGLLLPGANAVVSVAEQEVPSSIAALLIGSVPLWVILMRAATGDRVSLRGVDRDPLYNALKLDRATREVVEFARQDPVGYVGTLVPLGLYSVGATVYVPLLFETYATRYGVIGAVFAMISAFFVVMVILVASAAAGREVRDALRQHGAQGRRHRADQAGPPRLGAGLSEGEHIRHHLDRPTRQQRAEDFEDGHVEVEGGRRDHMGQFRRPEGGGGPGDQVHGPPVRDDDSLRHAGRAAGCRDGGQSRAGAVGRDSPH